MKSPVILLIVLGAALVAVVLALSLSNLENPGAIEKLLPKTLEGFALVDKLERVEAGFIEQGELYSAHASFAPLPGSVYEKHIDMLGIAIYLFKDEAGAKRVKELLLSGAQPELIQISNRTVALFGGEDHVGVRWHEKRLLYEILVTAPKEGEMNLELLRQAALAAAQVLIEHKHQ